MDRPTLTDDQALHQAGDTVHTYLHRADLRVAGETFRVIAASLGVSVETAHRYVNDGWERICKDTDEAREQLRDIQEARLDTGLRIVMELLTAQNLVVLTADQKGHEVRLDAADLRLRAIDRLVKIVTTQNQLRGLNAAVKIEEMTPRSQFESLEVLAARVTAKRAAEAAAKAKKA